MNTEGLMGAAPIVVALLTTAGLVVGCGGSDEITTSQQASTTVCQALQGTQVQSTSIALPTRGAVINNATVATGPTGGHCLVQGQIDSVDPTAQPIKFAIALPAQWNQRMVHLGGGGWDGIIPDTTGNVIASTLEAAPLAKGYAVFGADGGHTGAEPTFQTNFEQVRNYGGEQLKKVRDVAFDIVKRRYGTVPQRTFFAGGSNGGREAMVVLQRWGEDYDGILAVYPALAWVPTFIKHQQLGIAMRSNGGAGWINEAKALILQKATVQACDGLDGATDGIISNYNACNFDPRTLRCPNGADTGSSCLSDAQLNTIAVLETPTALPFSLANGINKAPSFDRGADWGGRILNLDLPLGNTPSVAIPSGGGTPSRSDVGWGHWYGDGFFRYGVLQNPTANLLAFNPLQPGSYLARMLQLSAEYDATNPDISKFLAKGGKLLMVHGTADQLVPSQPTIDYYKSIVTRYGQPDIDRAVRFYMIPGYAHVGGVTFNPAPGMSLFSSLEQWVETNTAPSSIVATDMNPNANRRTRPLCKYPSWPKYNGTGDVNAAASFTCVTS